MVTRWGTANYPIGTARPILKRQSKRGEEMTATLETVTLAGGNYRRNGSYNPPSVTAALSDGRALYLGGAEVKGFRGAADAADARGIDTTTFRAKLENWVKTGKFELESEAQN